MAEVSNTDITEIELNGAGTFDRLMLAVDRHLKQQYSEQKLRGTDYANVYSASLTTVLQQAIAFELGRQQADKQAELIDAQRLLVESQTIGQDKQNLILDCQLEKCEAEVALLNKELEIKDAQIINWGFQNQLIEKQIEKLDQDILLTQQQILNLGTQRDKMIAEISLIGKQEDKLDQDILVAKQQVLQSIQQVELLKQQIINLGADFDKTLAETALIIQRTTNTGEEFNILVKQGEKLAQEIVLLAQKILSEIAQTQDTINGVPVEGILGRKNELFFRQSEAFLRQAEQQAAKIFGDMWSVSKSADPGVLSEVEVFGDATRRLAVEGDPEYDDSLTADQQAYVSRPANPEEGAFTKLVEVFDKLRENAVNPKEP
jgi:hypothetical protein